VFPYSLPVTRPLLLKYDQAPLGKPPLHPKPHVNPQQVKRSSVEILSYEPVAMHNLSLIVSAAPKAQHDPHSD
jgi:hypothetical protein